MQSQRSAMDVVDRSGRRFSGDAALPARIATRPERPPALGTRSARKPHGGAAWLALALGFAVSTANAQTITQIIDSTGDGLGHSLSTASALAIDGSGNVYVTGQTSSNAFKITPGGQITQIIDASGDGAGNSLDQPVGVAVDGSGNVYVTGLLSHNAFKITPGGVITQIIDASGDGAGNSLVKPLGVAVDGSGNVYVTGLLSHNAFKITPGGVITQTIDATGDGAGNALTSPRAIAVDGPGNVYLTGGLSHNAFKITPGGVITQIIDANGDGTGNALSLATSVAVDGAGNVYVTGGFTSNAFKITPGGVITQIIDATGDGAGNLLARPEGIAVDTPGNVYVTAQNSQNAFKITPGGVILQIIDSTGDGAGHSLAFPLQIAVDCSTNAYVAGALSNNAFKIQLPEDAIRAEWVAVGASAPVISGLGTNDLVLSAGGVDVEFELLLSGWGQVDCAKLGAYQITLDGASTFLGVNASPPNPGVDMTFSSPVACFGDADCAFLGGPRGLCGVFKPGFCDDAQAGFIREKVCASDLTRACSNNNHCTGAFPFCIPNSDWALSGTGNPVTDVFIPSTGDIQYSGADAGMPASGQTDIPGKLWYGASLRFSVPAAAKGTYTIIYNPSSDYTSMADESGVPITPVELIEGTVTVEIGSCCYQIGLPEVLCVPDQTANECAARPGQSFFRPGAACPAGGGPPCPECIGPNDFFSCRDPTATQTGPDNLCTDDSCNALLCDHVDNYDAGTQCCDPDVGPGGLTPIDDFDVCTVDSCDTETGAVTHDPAAANGLFCDDGNECTVNDVCDGVSSQADGGCASEDVNLIPCPNGQGDCPVGECNTDTVLCECVEGTPTCRNGVCDPGEDSCNCPNDCGSPPSSETPGSTCSDGLDNDCDGLIDSNDPDCGVIPTVSQWGLIVLTLLLLSGAKIYFKRRQAVQT